MKRFIVLLSCISIFYAGAVWALEGCGDFGLEIDTGHRAEKSAHHHHGESHHSHSDPSKLHCPNVFGEFLVSSRVTITSDHSYVHHVTLSEESLQRFLFDMISGGFGDGPPNSVHLKDIPRHLLLSVIRI
jgi:hypothetical protein